MSVTIAAVFTREEAAQRAMEQILAAGIPKELLSSGITDIDSHHAKGSEGITRFFHSLFDACKENAPPNTNNINKRCTLINVLAQSEDQALRIIDIMEDCGALEVRKKIAERIEGNHYTNAALPIKPTETARVRYPLSPAREGNNQSPTADNYPSE